MAKAGKDHNGEKERKIAKIKRKVGRTYGI
jgi:hypothetical protein